ncbi:hypothetical protein SteCoe_1688 [Stentor coeruleus]|uniref:Uncharacterized protein n=1 Tax=Stentor coeruleus TaxID=5963 RepID=A0A1R2D160_9CILI|nr:hypothetical protein SteCoe_1688 [Stentor coeruleus]
MSIQDSNEILFEDKLDDSSDSLKDTLLAKCRETIENLYEEIESQKRQRREAELLCKENEGKLQTLEKKLKEYSCKILEYKEQNENLQHLNQNLNFNKTNSAENEISKLKEQLEESQQTIDDLNFKCERLTMQSKITETLTGSLKQAQEDYQKYLKEEKYILENKEKELKDKYDLLETKMKNRYQNKELQLKQEITESIQEIQKSLEINNLEHSKIRSENLNLKETIKNLNENLTNLDHSYKEQIERLEQENCNSKSPKSDKSFISEKSNSIQKYDKIKTQSTIVREKELENLIKILEEKYRNSEIRYAECKKNYEDLQKENEYLNSEMQKEIGKNQDKDEEIKVLNDRERVLVEEIKGLKEQIIKGNEQKNECSRINIKALLDKDYEHKVEEYKGKIGELHTENKTLRTKLEQCYMEIQRIKTSKEISSYELKESPKMYELGTKEPNVEEVHRLRMKIKKMQKHKISTEQKLINLKEDFGILEEKIKQDSLFFRNETMRKDDELNRIKKKFETKLREIYAENCLVIEQLRTDLLRLHNEIRNRDSKDSCYWISKNLEDLIKRIPSY